MNKYSLLKLLFLLWGFMPLKAQTLSDYVWHRPTETFDQFEGQGWKNMGFSRLPDKAEPLIRTPIWNLSRHAAGVGFRFETDSDSIWVRYQVDDNYEMHHMPATGVSGIDLYMKKNKEWLWCKGKYSFKDTISYSYKISTKKGRLWQYQLYLPLYNNVKNLEIGVPEGRTFHFMAKRPDKPIVIYGTSIAQGACASRPGMAWTNILTRKLDFPVINLGFSGNGRLEAEVITLINELDASVFVLDCLPNLSPNKNRTKEEIQRRIHESVVSIREQHPKVPILLVQHAGYADGLVDDARKKVYTTLNDCITESYENLKNEGRDHLHMLTKSEINLSNDAFVDGTHPNDLGMEQYAMAYSKKLRALLNLNAVPESE